MPVASGETLWPEEDQQMTVTNKLRVAVHDGADALDLVKVEVEGATGLAVEPVFQRSTGPSWS